MRALRRLVEARRNLVEDRVRITNRMTVPLKAYFPQVLELVSRQGHRRLRRLPRALAHPRGRPARPKRDPRRLLPRAQRPLPAAIDRRIEAIRSEGPLTTDPAVIEPMRLLVETLLPAAPRAVRWHRALRRRDRPLAAKLPDYELFAHLPGAGPVFAPRLLVAFGERRERFPDAAAAPEVRRRRARHRAQRQQVLGALALSCPTFLRQTFIEWVGQTIPRSFWAKPSTTATEPRARPTSRPACPRLQVDPHPLSLLGRPRALRRGPLLSLSRSARRRCSSSPPPSPLHICLRSASGRGLAGDAVQPG